MSHQTVRSLKEYRRHQEEARRDIINGLSDYEEQRQEERRFEANYRAMQLQAMDDWHADNPKAAKTFVDKYWAWIAVAGLLALVGLGTWLSDLVVAL